MRSGQRLVSTSLADIRNRVAASLARLPNAMRQFPKPYDYPVEIAGALQELAQQVDLGQQRAPGIEMNQRGN